MERRQKGGTDNQQEKPDLKNAKEKKKVKTSNCECIHRSTQLYALLYWNKVKILKSGKKTYYLINPSISGATNQMKICNPES